MASEDPFDLAAWVQGVVPATRTVPIYGRPDLVDHLDQLRDRLTRVKPDDADRGLDDDTAATLHALIQQAEAELRASAVDFRLEGRSSTRLEKVAEDAKAAGITDVTEVIMRQVYDGIVAPEGLTIDDLLRLNDVIEPQVVQLVQAARELNTRAPRVDVPFSPAPSAARSTRTT